MTKKEEQMEKKITDECCHQHEQQHHHEHAHDGSLKSSVTKIIVSAILLALIVWIDKTSSLTSWQLLLLYLIPYLLVGYETLHEAVENCLHGDWLDENFLMSIATIGALLIGFLPNAEPQFPEAVFVMLFFQIGEVFESVAEGKSRKSIAQLMNIRPDVAHVLRDGIELIVAPSDVLVGETILVKPGEKIPMDGYVLKGESNLDTLALTGESIPRSVKPSDEVLSGCVNISGLLYVKVTKLFGESTVSKIIELVENASNHKSKSESFITKFAKIYTPIVVFSSIALAFIPPFFSSLGYIESLSVWLYRALTFLIVSCPCALVISVPLTFFGGIGCASKNGVLVKGSNYLETLANLDTVVFDKTGTLTKGVFAVSSVHPVGVSSSELLRMAALAESYSNHPIANSLRNAYTNVNDTCKPENVEEKVGMGVKAVVEGKTVCVGNDKLMEAQHIERNEEVLVSQGTIVHVSVDDCYCGHIAISDTIKENVKTTIESLKNLEVRKTVILTGDHQSECNYIAKEAGVDEWHAELLPSDKVQKVEQLLTEKSSDKALAFVGDGINDAPVLMRADIGIAMGGIGSDAAIEAADVVLMNDDPYKIVSAIRVARHTLSIARQNVWFTIGIKVAVLLLAVVGMANMGMAVFADVGVCVIAILNSLRALNFSGK